MQLDATTLSSKCGGAWLFLRLKNNEERQFPGARIYIAFIVIINPGILVTYQSVHTVGLL